MEQALADYALVIKNVKEKVYNTGTSTVLSTRVELFN